MKNKKEKSKRVRHAVQNSSEVITDWIEQKKSHSYCRQAKFTGKTIYSYGTHYTLGQLTKINGRDVALINFDFASRTTTGQSYDAIRTAQRAGILTIKVLGSFSDAGIRAGIESECNKILESLIDSQVYGLYSSYFDKKSALIEAINEFNKKAIALGHSDLSIVVPKYFYDFGFQLGQLIQQKNKSIRNRKQLRIL